MLMKNWTPAKKNTAISILTTLITVGLIVIVICYNPEVKDRAVQKFSNSKLIVTEKYTDEEGNTYLILNDESNEFTVTIRNSSNYDNYQTSDVINANRYVMIHDDGDEEVVYYFSEKQIK